MVRPALLLPLLFRLGAAQKLVFVQVLWRHGDRSPTLLFPTDPWQSWPQGLGQITPEGMREELKLGQLLHRRYVLPPTSLLPEQYSQYQVHVRSTDVNRTLQSAYSVLAGLWAGSAAGRAAVPTEAGWPAPWLPVPVHTVPKPSDHLLYPLLPCPAYHDYQRNVQQAAPAFQAYVNKNKPFMKWLSTKTGKYIDINNIWSVGDEAFVEKLHNRTLPSWMNSTVVGKVMELKRFSSRALFAGVHQARLSGGPLLAEMTNRMAAFIACQASWTAAHCKWLGALRMYAYSAHDITVMALLSTLGRTDAVASKGLPPYSAAMALELWQEADGSFSVQSLYKDGYKAPDFVPIYPSGCPSAGRCPLGTFVARSRPYATNNVVQECQGSGQPSACPSSASLTAAEVVLSLVVLVLGLAVLYVGWKLYKVRQQETAVSPAPIELERPDSKSSTQRSNTKMVK